MPIAISGQMAANLSSLLSVNDQLSKTQERINTGKSVNSALDNAALYFKAESYSNKSAGLGIVNGNLGQALKNTATVNDALETMKKNLDGTIQTLKDARAKAVNVATQVKTLGGTAYTVAAGDTTNNPSLVVAAPAAGAAATNINNTTLFQKGDTFAITLTDTSGSSAVTTTRWFRAMDNPTNADNRFARDRDGNYVNAAGGSLGQPPAAAGTPLAPVAVANTVTADGSTEIRAANFNTMDDLITAVNTAFGSDAVVLAKSVTNVTVPTPSTTAKLGLALASDKQTISFANVYNNDPTVTGAQNSDWTNVNNANGGTPTALNRGATFDFGALFGSLVNPANNATLNLNAVVGSTANLSAQNVGLTAATKSLQTYTFQPNATAGSLASALEARRQAADTFKATLYNLQNLVNDASLPGFANILKGETVSVDLNETGEVKQIIRLGAVDMNTLGFGYAVDAAGNVTAANSAGNFALDNDLDAVITRSNTALATLRIRQNALSANNTMMSTRLEYNKNAVKTLEAGANDLTAADLTQEMANSSALTNRQNFAIANMGITKQAEAALQQLLR
jgi:flagellin